LSFKDYDVKTGKTSFVWFENFDYIFYEFSHTTTFTVALKNSLIAWAFNMLVGISFGMLFSYYIFKKMPASGFFKVLLFMPSIVSSVVMVMVYRQFVEIGLPNIVNDLFGWEMRGLIGNPDTYFGAILFYNLWVGFGTQILMFLGAMNNIPDGVLEAAKIDGAGHYSIFFQVMLPQAMPTMFAIFLLGFIGSWNDYMGPLLYLEDYPTLATGLMVFEKDMIYNINMPVFYAGTVILVLPTIVLFAVFSDKMMTSVSIGGLKG
jgi:ABC-type glycerol-3-phosphate transport system permease component